MSGVIDVLAAVVELEISIWMSASCLVSEHMGQYTKTKNIDTIIQDLTVSDIEDEEISLIAKKVENNILT